MAAAAAFRSNNAFRSKPQGPWCTHQTSLDEKTRFPKLNFCAQPRSWPSIALKTLHFVRMLVGRGNRAAARVCKYFVTAKVNYINE
ncbi:hypothetical protein CCACVL1_15869 [Corchorus capsularis]|uniref:Uncharacterized protein n=1 Tax=Corchorus capsularis TaxID=210143 RepID=A0A1R3I0R4_COCAP|nr:hypothetical protein CCACVL1_15869 [Corchorus capsularis]